MTDYSKAFRMEAIALDGTRQRPTGIGAIFASDELTLEAFHSLYPSRVPLDEAAYLIQLVLGDGQIQDAVPISREVFEEVVGESHRSFEEWPAGRQS